MPTTTVSASNTLAMAAMLLIIRPMKESTTSRDEMSMRTPRAFAATILAVRSSCSCMASWSCISTCTVTRRNRPIFRIGIFSIASPSGGELMRQFRLGSLESHRESIRQRSLGGHLRQVYAEVDDGLRNLRPDAADDAVRTHQTRRGYRLQKVLRDEGVHGRDARDVDDRDGSARLDDFLQKALHHDLGALTVEGTDEGQGENVVPELHNRGGQLHHLALLSLDDLLAALHIALGGRHAETIHQLRRQPHLVGEPLRVLTKLGAQPGEQRLLERED